MISERISDDIPLLMKKIEYCYPHSNALLQFRLEMEHCKAHKVACHSTKCDVFNVFKLFPTSYHWIYFRKI